MEINDVLNQKLHEIHRKRSKVGILPALVVYLASIYFQREKLIIDQRWIFVAIIMFVGLLLRILLVGPLFKIWSEGNSKLWALNILAFFLLGLGWGLHFLDVYFHYGPASQNVSFTLLILVAFITSSATTLMAEPTSYFPFVVTASIITAGGYFFPLEIQHAYVLFFILVFFLFSVSSYKVGHQQLVSLLRAQIYSDLETKRLSRIINTVPGFVTLIDDHERVYLANASVLSIYPNIIGMKVGEIANHADWEQSALSFMRSNLRSTLYESHRITSVGELFLLTQIQKLDEGGAIIVSIRINELVEARKKLREQEAKAHFSAKLASLGEMAAGIAHEVNNPLTIIQGSARIINRMVTEEPLDRENIRVLSGKMVETCDRISKTIRSLKALSRNGENDPLHPASVAKIVEECMDISTQKLRQLKIDLKAPEVSPDIKIMCREVQIGQVLLNLLGNAMDAVKNMPDPWVEIQVKADQTYVDILIIDSGSGIPIDIQEKIMEPFFTTKELNQGTGLGLSISKTILRDHHGELLLLTDQANTTFCMRLPAYNEKEHTR